MFPKIEAALQEVARETGYPYLSVEKVFSLSLEASEHQVAFHMIDSSNLTAVSSDDGDLPLSLKAEIDARYDDFVAVTDPVRRAVARVTTGHYQ